MTKSKLFEMEPDFFDAAQSVSAEALAVRLEVIKQRLLVLFGAVLMFVLLGMINPDMMEFDPTPLVWAFLWLGALVNGIYLLVSSKWRKVSLVERRDCVIGSLASSLLAFSFLPFYLFIYQHEEAVPFGLLIVIGGIILAVTYNQLGKSIAPADPIDDMFP